MDGGKPTVCIVSDVTTSREPPSITSDIMEMVEQPIPGQSWWEETVPFSGSGGGTCQQEDGHYQGAMKL